MAEAFNLTAQINLRGPTNLKAVVADIKKELGSVTSSVDIKLDSRAAKSLENTAKSLKNVNSALTNAKNNSATLSSSLLSLSGSLKNVGQGTTVIDKGVRSASKNMNALGSASKEASGVLESLGKNARITAKRFLIYTAVTRVFYGFTNAIDSAFKRYVEFDKQIIRLQQVTKNGSLGIKGLVGEIDRLSTSLGVSSEKLSQTAVTLSQAGFSANQTKQALEALATTELAPTFSDITKTTEGAIAAMKQFKLETGQLKEALGSINAVAGAFAVESDDIIAAIQRAGGVFASASIGVEKLDGSLKTGQEALNEFIGVFTSVRSQTRESAETIATGLRTIFTRIQRGSTIEYLKQFNVELQNQEGKFVGAYEAVQRLSAGLKDLDNRDPRFIKIVEELGGFRQIGKVLPLLNNFATAQEAVEIATAGVASLDKARNQGLQSLAVQLAKVNEQAFSLFKTIGDSKVFRGFLSVVLSLASSLIGLAKAFKPLLPVLAVLATLKIAKGIGNFASGLGGAIKAGGGAKGVGGGIGRSLTGTSGAGTRQETVALSQNTSALKNLTNAVINLGNKMSSSRNSLSEGGRVLGFNSGGVVPGSGNRDSVPAMLTPGEVVIDKKTANKYGRGNLVRLNSGGIADPSTKEVGAVILEFEKGNLSPYDIGLTDLTKGTKTTKPTKETANELLNKRTEGYKVIRSSFNNKETYQKFNDAINHGIISGVNATAYELIDSFKDFNIFGIDLSEGAKDIRKTFYDSINEGTRGNLFEDIIQSTVAKGGKFTGGPKDFFDFTGGIGAMSKYFNGLDNVKYIDAKASGDRAEKSSMLSKILNQAGLENKSVSDPNKETTSDELIRRTLSGLDPAQVYSPKNINSVLGYSKNQKAYLNTDKIQRMYGDIFEFDESAPIGGNQKGGFRLKKAFAGGLIQKFAGGGELISMTELIEEGSPQLRGRSNSQDELRQYFEDMAIGAVQAKLEAQKLRGKKDYSEAMQWLMWSHQEDELAKSIVADAQEDPMYGDVLSEFEGQPMGAKTKALVDELLSRKLDIYFAVPTVSALGPNITPELLEEGIRGGYIGSSLGIDVPSSIYGEKNKKEHIPKGDYVFFGEKLKKFVKDKDLAKIEAKLKGTKKQKKLRKLDARTEANLGAADRQGEEILAIDLIRLFGEQQRAEKELMGGSEEDRLAQLASMIAEGKEDVPELNGDPALAKSTNKLITKWNAAAKKGDWTKLALEQSAIDAILEDINDPNIFAALSEGKLRRAASKFREDFPAALAGKPLNSLQSARDLQQIVKAITTANYASGGLVQAFASGGTVPAMVSNGEAFIPPNVAKKIGYGKLEKMNQADKNGMGKFAAGGGVSVFKGPGNGTSDSIGPIGLPEGGFVLREKATKALGLASGGIVQKFAEGGSGTPVNIGQQIGYKTQVLKKLEAAQAEAEANFMRVAASLEKLDNALVAGEINNKNYTRVIEQKVALEKSVLKAEQDYEKITKQVVAVSAQRAALLAQPIAEKEARKSEQAAKAEESRAAMDTYNKREDKKARVADAYKDAAARAGKSPVEFNKQLRKNLIGRTSELKKQYAGTRADITTNLVQTRAKGLGSTDEIENFQRELGEKIVSIYGKIDANELQDTLDGIAISIMDGSSLPELIDTFPVLADVMDESLDSMRGVHQGQEEVIGQLGGLADELKLTADDIAEIDWRESGGAESLGLFGKALDAGKNAGFRQGGAYEFAQSDTGKRLQELQKKYSDFGDGIADKLGGISPILGKSVKGIASFSKVLGGIPGLAGAAGTILSDQFLPSLLKMGGLDNTATGAGIQGAFTEGAAGATLGATIGNAILPGIGGIIGSVAGAITGAIDGFIKGFKTKKLELTLSKLEGAITTLNKSFTDYEEVQSQANLDRIYQNISDANTISTDLQVQSQVDYGQQALSSAAKTTAASGAIAAAAVLLGVATAGTATVIVGAAALIAGALTYFTATADELDNQALAAYLGNLQQLNSALKQVAGIEIDKMELDPIQEVLDGIKNAKESESIYSGLKDTAIVQAGMKTGLTENQVYQRAAEEAIYQQSGGDEKLARKAMDELGSDELIKRGKEIVQLRTEQLYSEKKLSIQLRESQIEVENLVNKFEKVNAVIKAFSDGLDEFDANLKNQISSIRGEGKVNAASRRNINILRNPRGYDQAQFDAAAKRAGGLIGGETGQQAEQGLKAQRILDEQLPQILRDTSDQNTEAVTDKIAESLKGAGISASLTDSITKSLGETLDAKIGSRQGVSFDELSQNVPALTESLKGLQEQTKAAIAAEELFAKAMDQSAEYANEYVDALQNLRQRETQAITARIEGENRIAEALGERLSYEDRASSFFAELDSLAPGFRRGSEIDIQGITDERNAIRQRREGLEAQKAASSDPKLIGELNQQIADLANEDKNLVGALELVADSTQMLDAALSAYADRIAKENKQIGFMDRLATADPGELLQINSELGAVNTALSADPEAQKRFFADRTNRQNALAGLQQLDALGLDDKQFRQLEAQAKLSVFENTPGMSQLLDMKPAGGGDSVREILEKRAQGIATPEEENAQKALDLQRDANQALIDMKRDEAATMRAAITVPLEQAILALPGAIAAAIKGDTIATAGAAGVGGGTGGGGGSGSSAGTTGSAGGSGTSGSSGVDMYAGLSTAQLASKEEELKKKVRTLETSAGNARARKDEAFASRDDEYYTVGDENSLGGVRTVRGEFSQQDRTERLDAYIKLQNDLAQAQKELEAIKAAQMAKDIESFGGQTLPSPVNPVPTNTGSSYDVPLPGSVSTTALPSVDFAGIGQLGSLDISGLMANVDGVTTALNELKSSVDLAGTAFGAVQAFLTTTNIPLVLDDASTTTLNTFNTDFGNYVDKLSKINLPDTINIVGRHTVTVNINGGEAFTAMEESLSELIVTEVNTQLRRQTEGQLGSNYNR